MPRRRTGLVSLPDEFEVSRRRARSRKMEAGPDSESSKFHHHHTPNPRSPLLSALKLEHQEYPRLSAQTACVAFSKFLASRSASLPWRFWIWDRPGQARPSEETPGSHWPAAMWAKTKVTKGDLVGSDRRHLTTDRTHGRTKTPRLRRHGALGNGAAGGPRILDHKSRLVHYLVNRRRSNTNTNHRLLLRRRPSTWPSPNTDHHTTPHLTHGAWHGARHGMAHDNLPVANALLASP